MVIARRHENLVLVYLSLLSRDMFVRVFFVRCDAARNTGHGLPRCTLLTAAGLCCTRLRHGHWTPRPPKRCNFR